MSLTTTLSPLAISVVSDGVTLSCRSTSKPIESSTSATVSAATFFMRRSLAPSLMRTTLGVTTFSDRPVRPIEELRLVERSAPSKRRPISLSALATSVELTQYVRASPSTESSSGRPNCTAMAVPSVTDSSTAGATRSLSVTLTPSASSTSPTVAPMALTCRVCPSRVRVTSLLSAE